MGKRMKTASVMKKWVKHILQYSAFQKVSGFFMSSIVSLK